ncbi:MAG: hypothetical protein QM758_28225 [Armatimonas sp.]
MRKQRLWGVVSLCALAGPAFCQEPPVVELSARAFDGREAATYYGVSVERGGWFLRGVKAEKGASVRSGKATLFRGGSDMELGGTLPPWKGITPQFGVSIPDTPARHQKGAVTARLRWEQSGISLEPRAVLGRDALVGIAVGGQRSIGKFLLQGSVTPLVSGKNGIDDVTARPKHTTLWEAGISRGIVTVGATNALGSTTGFSLSPSIGGVALLVKVKVAL